MSRRNSVNDDDPAAANPFLQNNFAPVGEEVTAEDLTVVGELPPELNGMFVRNGPNPQFPPIKNYHVFEGDGMLHGVRIPARVPYGFHGAWIPGEMLSKR